MGRKWALLILMSIALGQAQRINELLRRSPGMSKRMLAVRLLGLDLSGFIARAEQRRGYVRWPLTSKGTDVIPVLLTPIPFASKWRETADASGGSTLPWGKGLEVVIHRSLAPTTPKLRTARERHRLD